MVNCQAQQAGNMKKICCWFLFLLPVFVTALNSSGSATYPVGDIRNCPSTQPGRPTEPLLRMEALPGQGFDNLRNHEKSSIAQRSYTQCKITNDGQYLVPDDFLVIPLQRARVDTFATFFAHWDDYTSMDAFSINVEASAFSLISGKFGFEYQTVKEHQFNDLSQTTRTQIRANRYKLVLQPGFQLDTNFKTRLLDIAANIQSNNTFYAGYLSDLLIRDYGTHIVKSVDAGALAAQIDSITKTYVQSKNSDMISVTAAASGSFFKGMFSVGVSTAFSHSNADTTGYSSAVTHSQIVSIGGPILRPNMTLEEWSEGLPDNLVAIDRAGEPLHYALTPESLPELPSPTLRELVDYVYYAVNRYYSVNTHYGCTDPSSPNFEYEANLNDGSCHEPLTNYSFGGVYQTCQVEPGLDYQDLCAKGGAQRNPLTGDFSCPTGYTAIELHNGTITGVSKKSICNNVCHHCHLFGWGRCCQCMQATINVMSAANYQAYWCVAEGKVESNHGFMFGGIYTTKSINPVSKAMSCPNHFYAVHVGENMEVCVSTEYELGAAYAVPFGGFISCQSGNPLAVSLSMRQSGNLTSVNAPKRCPKLYKRVLATVDEQCEISYCAKIRSQYSITQPILPPYRSKSILKKNLTQSLVIQGAYGEFWIKEESGNWVKDDTQSLTGKELLQELQASGVIVDPSSNFTSDSSSGPSSTVSVVISVAVTVVVCTVVALAVFGAYGLWKKRKQRRGRGFTVRGGGNNNYVEIENDDATQGIGGSSPSPRNARSLVTSYTGINDGDARDESVALQDDV